MLVLCSIVRLHCVSRVSFGSSIGDGMQGRDDIGRPLLQRAYDIQNKALGPNHPDVLAIADVLNSEDD